jgi:hypothetical protein
MRKHYFRAACLFFAVAASCDCGEVTIEGDASQDEVFSEEPDRDDGDSPGELGDGDEMDGPACEFTYEEPPDPGLTPESYVSALMDHVCAESAMCESKSDGWSMIGEAFACHSSNPFRQLWMGGDFLAMIEEGSIRFDAAGAEACLEELALAEPRCAGRGAVYAIFEGEACRGALIPTRSDGEPCRVDRQCVGGRCFGVTDCSDGTCGAPRAEGENCSDYLDCEAGLFCAEDSRCAPRRAAGESCPDQTACVEGNYCSEDGTCAPKTGDGSPCLAEGYSCTSGVCVGQWCEGPSDEGEACAMFSQECTGELLCVDGLCGPGLDVGEPCDSSLACRLGRCEEDRCVHVSGPGGPCETAGNCPTYHGCYEGRCIPLPALGEGCSEAFPCAAGACTDCLCASLPDGSICSGKVFYECEDGFCDTAAYLCTSFRPEGEICQASLECMEGLACDFDADPHVCVPACP